MRTIVAIAVGGALGTLARYGLGALVTTRTGAGFPWGTFVVNVTGAFVLGLLFALFAQRTHLPPWMIAAATVGFLGAYTTFSTFALETVLLAEDGRLLAAAMNVAASVVVGIVALIVGIVAGRAI